MKLSASITSNSVKLIEIYNKIISGALITGPDFQRKLVWKKQHKYAFIETILLNFPFPEVYIASIEVNIDTLKSSEVVVDGQQRLTTIVEYITGTNDFINQKTVKAFDDLSLDEKKEFLNYNITVKDLKDIGDEKIREVFKRINSTNYSLNSNEILNAAYGGGEFAMFCKALVESSETLSETDTDIHIAPDDRELFLAFFNKNAIFSDNDVRRMFDSQFIMLIVATLLEGGYFGRTTKIDHYLKTYNSSFDAYLGVLNIFKNSISLIELLNLSSGSYWFNKPNLFTLIFELRKVKKEELDLKVFETKLLDLEQKMDVYFDADDEVDIAYITEEERKYFEVARQGSNELSARELRGKLINRIINESKKAVTLSLDDLPSPSESLKELADDDTSYVIITPTETGLKKSIIDAVFNVREFLKEKGIHDYETQDWGPEHKFISVGKFINEDITSPTKISFYRSKGRGDYRIWFSDLNSFASANDVLAISIKDGVVCVQNLSKG